MILDIFFEMKPTATPDSKPIPPDLSINRIASLIIKSP
jgi:hypothetical protein